MQTRPTPARESSRRAAIRGLSGALLMLAAAAPGLALEEAPGEKAALKACEKRLCTMVLDKKPDGGDLACGVQKTWARSTLAEGEKKGVSWGFGDARCAVDLTLSRADLVAALTKPKHTVNIPAHQVKCVIEREGEIKPVTARLAPKLVFKDGKADKVWINLEDIDGPADVKSTLWAAAKLEDTLGIFHRPMIKSINKFLHKQCASRYGAGVEAKAGKKAEKKTAVAATPPAGPKADKPEPAAKPAAKATASAP